MKSPLAIFLIVVIFTLSSCVFSGNDSTKKQTPVIMNTSSGEKVSDMSTGSIVPPSSVSGNR